MVAHGCAMVAPPFFNGCAMVAHGCAFDRNCMVAPMLAGGGATMVSASCSDIRLNSGLRSCERPGRRFVVGNEVVADELNPVFRHDGLHGVWLRLGVD